jgi:hypothetical protein
MGWEWNREWLARWRRKILRKRGTGDLPAAQWKECWLGGWRQAGILTWQGQRGDLAGHLLL